MRAKTVIHRELDRIDVKLVRALQDNCRISMTELAETVELFGASQFLFATDYPHDDPGGRLVRFAGAYARTIATLQREGTTIEHVDLRYRNGFAARVPTFREGATRKPPATRVANAAPARGVQ